jgi:hypothetical protein
MIDEIKEYTDENGTKIIEKIVYKIIYVKQDKDLESQKRYYNNNKEKIGKYIKEYKKERYKNDEEYRERIKEKRRQNYALKKKEKEELLIKT